MKKNRLTAIIIINVIIIIIITTFMQDVYNYIQKQTTFL